MATQMAILARTRTLAKTLNPNPGFKTITTFSFLSQELQLAEPTHPIPSTPLPPNPASGSPLYNENWRNPIPNSSMTQSLLPIGFLNQSPSSRIHALSQTLDVQSLMNVFADWMTSQRWADMKQLFEFWIRSLDKNGKPNKPDVNLYNHYLRANLMTGASPGHMLDLVGHMEDYGITPNTASFNLVLKSMHQARETDAAEKLLERMLQTGNESPPDDESYDLVVGMLFQTDRIDAALKYIDLTLKSGYMLSMAVFRDCVQGCADKGKLDILVSIIDKCKVYYQLENLSRADPPYKSVAALNCIILGCANIWHIERAYQTFDAISSSFELTPDIHSYNALMYAFGKFKQTVEASNVFGHLVSLGIKPNAKSYSLLVDAHLVNKDPKSALSVIDDMVNAGFEPSRETLKKVRRRCMREMDYESDDRVDSLAKRFRIQLGSETRRNILFNLNYSTGYA